MKFKTICYVLSVVFLVTVYFLIRNNKTIDSETTTVVTTTTTVIPGDTSFTKVIGTIPSFIGMEIDSVENDPVEPIIIYLERNENMEVDTAAIIEKYLKLQLERDQLKKELAVTNIYSDTIHSDTSEVVIIINDRVKANKLLPGRSVFIKNLRPKLVSTTTVSNETKNVYKKNALFGGGNIGTFGPHTLAGFNLDLKTKRNLLIGTSISWDLNEKSNLYLLRFSFVIF